MSRRTFATACLALAAFATACGPFLLIPGGQLEGATVEAPADWSLLDAVDTVQLETLPSEPYSVNIWAIGLGENVYVHAGANRSAWIENMETDPNVRLQIEESIYELEASRVGEQAEFDRFADAYEEKYGSRPRNESVQEAYLFRLRAR